MYITISGIHILVYILNNKNMKKNKPKIKKYALGGEGGYSTPEGTFDADGNMIYGPYGQPLKNNKGLSGQQYANIGAGIASGANYYGTTQDPDATLREKQNAATGTVAGVAGAINPTVGSAISASTQIAQPIRNWAEETNPDGSLKHPGRAKFMAAVGSQLSPSQLLSANQAGVRTLGDYTKKIESENKKRIAEENAPLIAANQAYMNQLYQPQYFAKGGMMNSQVELDENSIAPDGRFTQYNEPPHSMQNPNIPNAALENGEKVFTAKFGPGGRKGKTFADLNKKNNTNKEEKVLEDYKASHLAKSTAELNAMVKRMRSEDLFAQQESMKKSKLKEYANKLGINLEQNETNSPEMSIAKNGGMFIMENGGKLPEPVLRTRLESHMSSEEAQDYIDQYGSGGYVVKRSNDRKGKTHVVIGPDGTKKYFGDSKLGQHPNDPERKKAFYARHKHNLANNPYFRAFARKTWEEGGMMIDEYANGGEMIKRADGTYSKRGLWDNIRANAGSGKKPTPEMLEQERKIKEQYAEGGIYIKPSKRGTFTAAATKHGKSVQAFASQVLANKENYSPAMVKKANFARNAAKWHHEMGGVHMYDNGGYAGKTGQQAYDMDREQIISENQPKERDYSWVEPLASGLAQTLPSAMYLGEQGKKYDTVNYPTAQFKAPSYSEALRQANLEAAMSRRNLRETVGGNAGAYMSNLAAIQAANTAAKAGITQQGQNLAADVYNREQIFNIPVQIQSMQDTAANKAAALAAYYKAEGDVSSKGVSAYRDWKAGEMDADTFRFMSQAMKDPQTKREMLAFLRKRGYKKV